MSWTARLTAPFQRKFIQNTLTSRMQKRAYSGGVLSEEEALAGSKQWIKATIFGTAICSAVLVYVLSEEEHAYHRNPYPYAHIRSKKYPWADGDSELFMLLGRKLGRTYGEDHKEDHE
jgi:hypothetical protein